MQSRRIVAEGYGLWQIEGGKEGGGGGENNARSIDVVVRSSLLSAHLW